MADFTVDVLIPHLFPIPDRLQQTLSWSLPVPGRHIVEFVSSFDIRISDFPASASEGRTMS
jgi:hypothetical protein